MVQRIPIIQGTPIRIPQPSPEKMVPSFRVNMGMISAMDPADISNEALTDARNLRIRLDRPIRRNGYTIISASAPDGNTIDKLYWTKLLNDSLMLLRFTTSKIHRLGVASWIQMFSGTLGPRLSVATIYDRVLVADGINNILYSSGGLFAPNTDAPVVKFVTGFYDRAIGAYTNASDGAVEVKWSAIYNPGDPTALRTWDFSVNAEAGFEKLVENPNDVSNFITGLTTLGNNLIVLRDRSLTIGLKQASPTAPIRFYSPENLRVGSDCSYATELTNHGLCFADSRTRSIYLFDGNGLSQIQVNVEPDLFAVLGNSVDPVDAFSSYDSKYDEYHIQFGVHDWVFNFRNKAWTYDESALIGGIKSRLSTDAPLTIMLSIDELAGNIDSLVGTIDGQNGQRSDPTSLYIGNTGGNVYFEDASATSDASSEYDSVLSSKDFSASADTESTIRKLLFQYRSGTSGMLKIEYSPDQGSSWVLVRDWYTYLSGLSQMIVVNDVVTVPQQYRWRVSIKSGKFELLRYGIDIVTGGSIVDSSI